jgi:hypothetical protein
MKTNVFILRLWLLLFVPALCQISKAQTPVTSYLFSNRTSAVTSTNTAPGWNSAAPFASSSNFTMNYGQTSGGGGLERELTGFNVGTRSYSRAAGTMSNPFTKVTVNRHPLMPGDTINMFYEFTGSGSLLLSPSYVPNLEDVVNSYVCNRGSDNLFSNSPTTRSNIERLDLIRGNGLYVTDATQQGFLINERGGNDNFKAAAILSINGSQVVTALGPLLTVSSTSWGRVGPSISTRVMSRRIGTDAHLRPKEDISAQTISGVYISLASLGVSNGSTVYGICLFPNDVTSSMDLIGLRNVPTNTSQSTDGGLDMVAGMGYFVENHLLPQENWFFKAEPRQNTTLLQWQTAPDARVEKYIVERSNDGVNFSIIDTVLPTIGQALTYRDTRSNSASSVLYYRIRAVRQDGSTMFSQIEQVQAIAAGFRIYPNPFTDWVEYESHSNIVQTATLQLFNEQGKLVVTENFSLTKGWNKARYHLNPTLPNGIYYLYWITGNERKYLIVQKR